MSATTIYLRFADRAAALAALTARGMAAIAPDGEPMIPSPGYLGGVRYDIRPLGGDGVHRKQVGTEAIEIDGLGTLERPVFEIRPGWHCDLVWHGPAETAPDFGEAVVSPLASWSYDGEAAAGLPPIDVPTSVTRFQARAALLEVGLLDQIEAAVAAADTLTREAWASATAFERSSPTIAALAAALGMTGAALDALFRRAAQIRA